MIKIILSALLVIFNLTLVAQTHEDYARSIIKKEKEIELKDSIINVCNKQSKRYLDSIYTLKRLINNFSAWKYKFDSLDSKFLLLSNAFRISQQGEDSVKTNSSVARGEVYESNDVFKIKRSLDSLYALPLDVIVKQINITTFNRDKIWLTHRPQLKNSLQYIFDGQQCLAEKYNSESISQSVRKLKSLEQTQIVKNLIKSLSDYNAVNESLKKAIREVMEMEKDGYDKALGDKVFRKQMPPLLVFIYQQRCTYDEFPYLFNVLVEAINIKGSDQSKTIGGLLNKL